MTNSILVGQFTNLINSSMGGGGGGGGGGRAAGAGRVQGTIVAEV